MLAQIQLQIPNQVQDSYQGGRDIPRKHWWAPRADEGYFGGRGINIIKAMTDQKKDSLMASKEQCLECLFFSGAGNLHFKQLKHDLENEHLKGNDKHPKD